MNTYEYYVTQTGADKEGRATVPSICSCAIKAVDTAMNYRESQGNPLILTRSEFEITERPMVDDLFNILVIPGDNKNVTSINTFVLITDSEGQEIGRGSTEWITADHGQKWPVSPEKCLKEFYRLLPEEVISGGLQSRIELDCHGMVHNPGEMTFEVRKTYFDRFLFQARCGEETLCQATLQIS